MLTRMIVDWTHTNEDNYHYNETITPNSDSVEWILCRVEWNFNHTSHCWVDHFVTNHNKSLKDSISDFEWKANKNAYATLW